MRATQGPGQIVAIGGAGFSLTNGDPLLLRFALGLLPSADANATPRARPKVCYLGQASGEPLDHLVTFYQTFSMLDCETTHLSLFQPPTADLHGFLFAQDLIYVGGGNTKSMLALWREWELDRILRDAWEQGMVLMGSSAGSICWFEQGVTDSIPGDLTPLPCLGFLAGSDCPHYDSEPKRRPTYQRLVREGQIADGYACDDGAALHYVGTQLQEIVSSRAPARAYRVEKAGDDVSETVLTPRYLG